MNIVDDRPIIAARFRQLAEECDRYSRAPTEEYPAHVGRAGDLVVAAFRRGYLPVPELAKLIAWLDDPNPDTTFGVPSPGYVFVRLAGHDCTSLSDDFCIPRGMSCGGVLPVMMPDILPGWDNDTADWWRQFSRHHAVVCYALATTVETAPQGGDRDAWIYAQAQAGAKWSDIREAVAQNGFWNELRTDNAVKMAATRHAERHSLPLVLPRAHGRPSSR